MALDESSAYSYLNGSWSSGQPLSSGTTPLTSISCPTAEFCAAVGDGGYVFSAGDWSSEDTP
jgi:hypothetical protein